MSEDELYHYGVVGMKWGVRRARKKGTTYTYKSHSTKKYEKKAAKATNKDKKALYEQRAKRSAQHDRNMQDIAESQSAGKTALKYFLGSGLMNTSYDRVRAAGNQRATSAVSAYLTGPLAGYVAKSNYIRDGERK